MTTVAQQIVDVVQRWGIRHVFCLPGESYLATLQEAGTRDGIALVSTRHEEGAGLMADAYAKASGRPGVCMVTRGPGLTHLTIALHTAQQDSTPLVVVVGQVPSDVRHREAFQEVDIVEFVKPMTKWAAELTEPQRVAELVERAFEIATTGRPGPVVLSLPEDLDRAEAPPASPGVRRTFLPAAHPEAIDAAADLLHEYPDACVIAGGGINTPATRANLISFATAGGFGVYAGWRRFDVFPNDNDLYLGPLPSLPGDLYRPLREAQTIVAVGTRLGEFSTLGYTVPSREQRLIHIDVEPRSFDASFRAADSVVIQAEPADALAALTGRLRLEPKDRGADRARYLESTVPVEYGSLAVDPAAVVRDVVAIAPQATRVVTDAGTFAGWVGRYLQWTEPRTFFAPTAGGMGYAVPAAIGVKLEDRTRPVVAFAGDGGMAMTMSELETAVRLGLGGLVYVVFNNSCYGTIARHQEAARYDVSVGVQLGDVDFAGIAKALGATGQRIESRAHFGPAFAEALKSDRPTVLDVVLPQAPLLDPWGDWA